MTDNTLSAPLTAEEQAEFQDALWRLLSAQAARFTMGESTSLPAEKAEALLASVVYTLGVSPDDLERIRSNPIARAVKCADLRHNCDPSRLPNPPEGWREKRDLYRKALEILTDE